MIDNYAMAEHWLEQSELRKSDDSGRDCLMTAHIYAMLAISDAISNGLRALARDLQSTYP